MSLRLAMIDDHRLFREGLRALLERQPDFEIVGEAADDREALALVEQTKPDLAIVDVMLSGVSGIAVTRELVQRLPDLRILMLSMHAREDFVAEALAAGAHGYSHKDQPAETIIGAIRTVMRGETYLAPTISGRVLESYRELRRRSGAPAGPLGALSRREREVFDLLIRGFGNRQIGRQLFISVKTVETHRAHILRKLHVHSIAELVRYAALHGLVLH
jgi:DNA-binding NarL/FixJ family response regulator